MVKIIKISIILYFKLKYSIFILSWSSAIGVQNQLIKYCSCVRENEFNKYTFLFKSFYTIN